MEFQFHPNDVLHAQDTTPLDIQNNLARKEILWFDCLRLKRLWSFQHLSGQFASCQESLNQWDFKVCRRSRGDELMRRLLFDARRSFLFRSLQLIIAPIIHERTASAISPSTVQLNLPLVDPVIVVTKSKRRLELYSKGRLLKKYHIGLGLSPVEDKIRSGDRRTPEGEFYICLKNPRSQFYLSLQLSYPNAKHAERGLRDGLITREQYNQTLSAINNKRVPPQHTPLGGELFIHGNGSHSDWTWGCVALDDNDIRELYNAIPVGTPVTIKH